MILGIISDTHDRIEMFPAIAAALAQAKVAQIIHCGDWVAPYSMRLLVKTLHEALPKIPIAGVLGNNDGDHLRLAGVARELGVALHPLTYELEFNGKKVIVYHGTDPAVVAGLTATQKYDLVCRGHTHIAGIEMAGKATVVNPGTTSHFVRGQFLKKPSLAIYDSVIHKAKILSLDA